MVPLGTNTCFIETFAGVRDKNTKIPRVNESPVKLAHHNIADTNLVVDDNVLEKLGVLQNRTSIFALPLKTTKMYTIGSHEHFETEKKKVNLCHGFLNLCHVQFSTLCMQILFRTAASF